MYRIAVAISAVVICVAGGVWAAFMLPYPFLVTIGASVGLALGALCAFLLVHQRDDAHGSPPGPVERHSRH